MVLLCHSRLDDLGRNRCGRLIRVESLVVDVYFLILLVSVLVLLRRVKVLVVMHCNAVECAVKR